MLLLFNEYQNDTVDNGGHQEDDLGYEKPLQLLWCRPLMAPTSPFCLRLENWRRPWRLYDREAMWENCLVTLQNCEKVAANFDLLFLSWVRNIQVDACSNENQLICWLLYVVVCFCCFKLDQLLTQTTPDRFSTFSQELPPRQRRFRSRKRTDSCMQKGNLDEFGSSVL